MDNSATGFQRLRPRGWNPRDGFLQELVRQTPETYKPHNAPARCVHERRTRSGAGLPRARPCRRWFARTCVNRLA